MLNSDIDMVEEQNKQIAEEIEYHGKLISMSNSEKTTARENLEKEIEETKTANAEREEQISNIESQMSQIKDFVEQMVACFRSSHFKLAVASRMQYDEQTQFNENNVTMYLAELEEFVSSLITYVAQRDQKPDAQISALNLDQMTVKEYDKGPISIENMPNSNQFTQSFEDDATTEDDIITNKRDLFRKFEEFAQKGYIDNLSNKGK